MVTGPCEVGAGEVLGAPAEGEVAAAVAPGVGKDDGPDHHKSSVKRVVRPQKIVGKQGHHRGYHQEAGVVRRKGKVESDFLAELVAKPAEIFLGEAVFGFD